MTVTPTPHLAQSSANSEGLPVQGTTIIPSGNAAHLSSPLAASGNTATATTSSPTALPCSILSTPPSSFALPSRSAFRKHTPPTGGTGGRNAEFLPPHSSVEASFHGTSPKREERLPYAFMSGLHPGGRGGAEDDSSSEHGSGHGRSHRGAPAFSPSVESVSHHTTGHHPHLFFSSPSSATAETTASNFAVFSDPHGSTSPATASAATVARADGGMSAGGKERDGTVGLQEQENILRNSTQSRRWSSEGEYEKVASAAGTSTALPPSFRPEGVTGSSSDTSTPHVSSGLQLPSSSNGFPNFSTSFSSTLTPPHIHKGTMLTDAMKGLPPSSSSGSPFAASFLAQGADLINSAIASGGQDGSSATMHIAGGANVSQLSSYATDAATTTTTRGTTAVSSYHVQGESGHGSQAGSIASSIPKAAVSSLYGLPSSTSLAEPGIFSKAFFSGASDEFMYQSQQYMVNEEETKDDSSLFEHEKVALAGVGASESRKRSPPSSFQVDLTRPFQTENIWTD